MGPARPLVVVAAAALYAGCNIDYSRSGTFVSFGDASYPLDHVYTVDRVPFDAGTPVDPFAAIGLPCEDAACPAPLLCAPRSCGPERSCVAPMPRCEQGYDPVCDCDGNTRQNECAARAANVGVAYAGACDGRAPDGGAGDAAAADAGVNRCERAEGCGDGEVCCAEPRSASYGRCEPVRCAACCVSWL